MLRTTTAIALISLGTCLPALAAGHGSVPPASFLKYHVGSVPELSQEVTLSPLVRARLARHFHVSEAAMSRYVSRNLTLSHLKKSGYYQVACVRPNGREYWVKSHLSAGTLVFASRATGQPILKLACGNPMVSSLPAGREDVANNNGKMAAPQVSQTASALSQNAALVTPLLMTEPSTVSAVMVADALPSGVADIQAAPVVKTAGSFQFARLASVPALSDLGPALLGAGAIAALAGSGGHGGSSPAGGPGPSPVPETSSSVSFGALLLMGGTLLVIRRKRLAK